MDTPLIQALGGRGRKICEFEASLINRVLGQSVLGHRFCLKTDQPYGKTKKAFNTTTQRKHKLKAWDNIALSEELSEGKGVQCNQACGTPHTAGEWGRHQGSVAISGLLCCCRWNPTVLWGTHLQEMKIQIRTESHPWMRTAALLVMVQI